MGGSWGGLKAPGNSPKSRAKLREQKIHHPGRMDCATECSVACSATLCSCTTLQQSSRAEGGISLENPQFCTPAQRTIPGACGALLVLKESQGESQTRNHDTHLMLVPLLSGATAGEGGGGGCLSKPGTAALGPGLSIRATGQLLQLRGLFPSQACRKSLPVRKP